MIKLFQHLEADRDNALARLKTLLAIPSVSTDPAKAQDVRRTAEWLVHSLRDAGLDADLCPTGGHPVVLGRTRSQAGAAKRPRVLFYGHYDVQPAEPLDQWHTPPFEPTVRNGAIYARGASDDKGQVLAFIEALRAWNKVHGHLPVDLTVLIEGEEEIGSPNLRAFLQQHRAELDAARHDFVLISDTSMWDRQTVAITYALRGLQYFDVQLHGPGRDLHSGTYGGTVPNPAVELTAVLGRLFDAQHRVTIPGFYDDVLPLSEDERRQWKDLPFDEQEYFRSISLTLGHGESGFATLERRWARPSCDINGLYGGYGGPGAKTVIPAMAGAKISFRLAANQQASKIAAAFQAWLQAQDVHGCTWKITDLHGADPVITPVDSPYVRAASRAIQTTSGRLPVLVRDGATIPVVIDFKKILGLDSLLIGFGLPDDCLHSPNEKFDLSCFALGAQTHAALLGELSA